MQGRQVRNNPNTWSNRWLVLSVHGQAFCTDPLAYLTAVWWRVRGKTLRSRYQFASLLGRTRLAYRLWWIRAGEVPPGGHEVLEPFPIVALIDAQAGRNVAESRASLEAECVTTLVVGSPQCPTLKNAVQQIDWRDGLWLMPLQAGDRLGLGAMTDYGRAIAAAETQTKLIYADDDLIDERDIAHTPHFKPDWNEELFRHHDYLTGACILRATRADLLACASAEDWMASLTERIAEEGAPVHLPRMLHRRCSRPLPVIPAAPAVEDRDLPPVSIIVPTRNRVDLLRTCLDGVAETAYPDIEVIIVDNDSDDPETLAYLNGLNAARHKIIRQSGAFNFSAINNRAAKEARGHLLCLLNNDIEITDPDWLRIMAVQAQREEVGAVGARLLYPDGRIQHAGVVLGMGNAAGHAHKLLQPDEEGYFHRHSLPQFATAVTAACLVVEKEKYMAVGGLNEVDFAVAFNDVDFCLRLNQRGWQSFYEPRATLIHHESLSRGFDRDSVGAQRFEQEVAAWQKIWGDEKRGDPYHHPALSCATERFVVRL